MSSFRFLPGIVVGQVATAALVIAALDPSSEGRLTVFLAIAAITSLLLTLWFGSIAENIRKDSLIQAKDDFAREREQILVSAEADKRSMLQESHEQIVRETNRAHARANLKLGAALAGLLGIGVLLLAIEFVSIGLMTLTAAGGMLAGYVMRARQDALRQREKMLSSLAPPAVDFLATEEQKTLPPAPGR